MFSLVEVLKFIKKRGSCSQNEMAAFYGLWYIFQHFLKLIPYVNCNICGV